MLGGSLTVDARLVEPSGIGQPIIAGDGYAYFPYPWGNSTGFENVCDNGELSGSLHTDFHLRILRAGTDGSSKETTIGDWSMDRAGVNDCAVALQFSNQIKVQCAGGDLESADPDEECLNRVRCSGKPGESNAPLMLVPSIQTWRRFR